MIAGTQVGMVIDAFEGPIFIISDVHAGALTPEQEHTALKRLRALLEHAMQSTGRLIILGDLFDYWQEAGQRTPKQLQPWVNLLSSCKNEEKPTILITGNHDHWAGPALARHGVQVVRDHVLVTAPDGPWLLLHGDGLPTEGLQLHRKGLNRTFRSPLANKVFRIIPLQVRVAIMRAFSMYRKERGHDAGENAHIQRHLQKWLECHDFSGLVFGHTHVPGQWNIAGKHMVNTGTFYTDGSVMVLDGRSHKLTSIDAIQATESHQMTYIKPDGTRR